MVTRQDLTTAIERMSTRRVKIGNGDKYSVIPIHRNGDSVEGSVTTAGKLLIDDFDPSKTKFKFSIIEGEGWFSGTLADIEALVEFVKANGKSVTEKILNEQSKSASSMKKA